MGLTRAEPCEKNIGIEVFSIIKLTNLKVVATGFIDSNLIAVLLIKFNEMVCLDNFSAVKQEKLKVFVERNCLY